MKLQSELTEEQRAAIIECLHTAARRGRAIREEPERQQKGATVEGSMIVTAWTNGSGSYGLRIDASDRDKFFKRDWKTVMLKLDDEPTEIEVNLDKSSFWSPACRELIHLKIGKFLEAKGLAPWTCHNPPELWLEPISRIHFQLRMMN